jgi:hypothetical protein
MPEKNLTPKELLAAFTVLDTDYKNAVLRYIPGTPAENAPDIDAASIENPATAVGAPDIAIGAKDDYDPVLFAFTVDGPELRILFVKVGTDPVGGTSLARYSVLDPNDPPSGTWQTLARDVHLRYNNADVLGNPHGLAQVEDTLYFIEYDTQKIWSLGVDKLDGKIKDPDDPNDPGDPTYDMAAPIDLGLGTSANLPADAKGQDLIYLQNGNEYLFALYIVNDSDGDNYQNSILVRLKKVSGAFVFDGKVPVGKNAQNIHLVKYTPPSTQKDPEPDPAVSMLLIPVIGGKQEEGSTNGTFSNICKVDPFAVTLTAAQILTGDAMPGSGPPTTFDIASIAPQDAVNGLVFILTHTFDTNYTALYWKVYKTTADQLLTLSGSPTLSSLEGTVLSIEETGPTLGVHGYGGLSYWDIVYENGTGPNGGRLWYRRDGIHIHDPHVWANTMIFDVGLGLGQIGGTNINSFDLAAEVIRQAKAGVSLKRGFKSFTSRDAAALMSAAGEEEEEK